jgi:aerobic-type carbon monoxide dehydrogenase small subunit (CoxS/CutS family)
VSRRDFLRGLGVGGGALGAGLLPVAAREKQPAPPAPALPTLGPGPIPLTLRVNGRTRTVRVEPRLTLLDVLRDRLDLTGTKQICDRGECGGCTVLADGRPVFACMMLAVDARRKSITTVEALAAGERLHPVQEAFIEKDALQCGFCTPGFVVAAKALLDANPRPTPGQVREALCGHLCRCGTYPRVFEAVLAAAQRPGPRKA